MTAPNPAQPSAAGLELRQILVISNKLRWVMAIVTIAVLGTAGFLNWLVLPKVRDSNAALSVSQAVAPQQISDASTTGQGLQGVVMITRRQITATALRRWLLCPRFGVAFDLNHRHEPGANVLMCTGCSLTSVPPGGCVVRCHDGAL